MQHMVSLARELGLLGASEPGSPAGRQPSWAPLLARCTPPPPSNARQPGESELLRQFSGQFDLPLMDPLPQQPEPPAVEPDDAGWAPQVLQPGLEGQPPSVPEVQLRPVGRCSPQPQQRPCCAQQMSPAGGVPALGTPSAVPQLQRAAQPPPQQRKEKKSPNSRQEQKAKQPVLKQRQLKKKQKAPASKPAGRKAAATATPLPKRAGVSEPERLLLQAGTGGFTEALVAELRRYISERQAAEAATRHREERQLLQEAQAQQRQQVRAAQAGVSVGMGLGTQQSESQLVQGLCPGC